MFPAFLKLANTTCLPKRAKNSKENYKPISIPANISKIYERDQFEQMSNYFENIFSKFQCGFRQRLSAQYYLMSMTEKCKKSYRPVQRIQLSLT